MFCISACVSIFKLFKKNKNKNQNKAVGSIWKLAIYIMIIKRLFVLLKSMLVSGFKRPSISDHAFHLFGTEKLVNSSKFSTEGDVLFSF